MAGRSVLWGLNLSHGLLGRHRRTDLEVPSFPFDTGLKVTMDGFLSWTIPLKWMTGGTPNSGNHHMSLGHIPGFLEEKTLVIPGTMSDPIPRSVSCMVIWRFPKIGLPLAIIHFRLEFAMKETIQRAIGVPPWPWFHHSAPLPRRQMLEMGSWIILQRCGDRKGHILVCPKRWAKQGASLELLPETSNCLMCVLGTWRSLKPHFSNTLSGPMSSPFGPPWLRSWKHIIPKRGSRPKDL